MFVEEQSELGDETEVKTEFIQNRDHLSSNFLIATRMNKEHTIFSLSPSTVTSRDSKPDFSLSNNIRCSRKIFSFPKPTGLTLPRFPLHCIHSHHSAELLQIEAPVKKFETLSQKLDRKVFGILFLTCNHFHWNEKIHLASNIFMKCSSSQFDLIFMNRLCKIFQTDDRLLL